MNLRQVKGNTWVLEGLEFIPLYRLDGGRCVLLDTGLAQEREELEQALLDHGLTPAGILCSHAHVDHGGNNRYFQEKYHIPVALTSREAGMCASLLSLKCYFLLLSPDMVEQDAAGLVHTPDVLIPDGDGPFSFAGAEFQILQTPGHSVGHISTLTPDRVCYVGDALLSREQLDAKLPYCLSHRMGMESREKLRGLDCDLVVMAHRGIARREELEGLIDANQALALRRAGACSTSCSPESPAAPCGSSGTSAFSSSFWWTGGTWSWRRRTASRSTAPPAEAVETWQRRVF